MVRGAEALDCAMGLVHPKMKSDSERSKHA